MIDPTLMGAVEWTDRMAQVLPDLLPLKIEREKDWKAWAWHAVQSAAVSARNPPNPAQFSDWREWAYRFNNSVFT